MLKGGGKQKEKRIEFTILCTLKEEEIHFHGLNHLKIN